MRLRAILLGGFLLVAVWPVAVRAEEVPYLEFVHGLRANNYPDLALEYLNDLAKRPNLPKELKELIPFEIARAQMDLATNEPEEGKRNALYATARKQLDAFLKTHGALPQAADANLDIARIPVLQGRALAAKARQEEGPSRLNGLKIARAKYEDAGRQLEQASRRVAAQAEKGQDAHVQQVAMDAEMEIALNLLDQMLTFDSEKEAKQRAVMSKRASEALKKIAYKDDKNSVNWLARAWLIRLFDEIDSFPEAIEEFKKIGKASGTQMEPGRRLARLHYIQVLAHKDPSLGSKETLNEVMLNTREWLRDYSSYRDTNEGYAVRYQLAQACRVQAEKLKDQRELLSEAERLYEGLEFPENEYSPRARQHRVQLMIKRRPELAQSDIQRLMTFSDCFLRAQIEVGQMADEEKKAAKEPEAAEQLRRKHFLNIIATLTRALEFDNDSVAPAERIEARYLLMYSHLMMSEFLPAALIGEDLARSYPQSSRAGTAGAYALHAYGQIVQEDERSFAAPDTTEIDRGRMLRLATYVETNWPNDVAADVARHQIGTDFLRQKPKKLREAFTILSQIAPSYGRYGQVQFLLGSNCLLASKEKLDPMPGKASWLDLATEAFRKIPEPSSSDPEAVIVFVYGKIELARMYFAAKNYDEMEKATNELLPRFAQIKDEKTRQDLDASIKSLPIYAKYGKAEVEFHANRIDRYARVRALLDPIVDQAKAKTLPAIDATLLRGLLGLALRASVLDGKTDRAKDILDLLQTSAGDFENSNTILVELVQQFRAQLEELRKKGPSFRDEYDKTVTKFTAFLDELGKQPLQKLKPEMIRFLAYSYSGLEKHEKAAELLARVPNPTSPEDEKFFQTVRILYARELRLAKKHDEAGKVLQELMKTEAGKQSLDAKKEEIFLLEDREQFAPAANAWNRLMSDLKRVKDVNPQHYNDCLYHYIVCLYKYGQKATDAKKKQDFVTRAARLIVNIEASDPKMGGLKERYQDLLDKESPLKKEYDNLSKAQKKSS